MLPHSLTWQTDLIFISLFGLGAITNNAQGSLLLLYLGISLGGLGTMWGARD